MKKTVITVVGKDTVGIIARVCTYLADNGINILDISQTIVQGYFNMMMIVDTGNVPSFDRLAGELEELYRIVSDRSHAIHHGYLCVTDAPKDSIVLQEGETIGYRWIGREELIAFFDSDACILAQRERLKEYMDSIRSSAGSMVAVPSKET